ncbi:MAG TPA: MMPL family transporter [Myxococcales bacterium]
MNAPPSARRGALARVTEAAVARPAAFLLASLLVAAVSVWAASHLEIRSSFQELLPSDLPSVRQVQDMIKRVGGDGTVLVSIESLDGPSGLKNAEAMAPVLARDFLALGPSVIRSVESNVRPVEAWYEDHWPLFATLDQLTEAREELRKEVRKRKIAANPLGGDLFEDEEPQAAAGPAPQWMDPKQPLPREMVAQRFDRYVDGFLVHPDKTSLTVVLRPAGTSLGVAESKALMERLHAVADRHAQDIKDLHLRIGWGGTFPIFIAEYEAIIGDVAGTAVLVVTIVLASILLFFRDLRSTVSLGIAVLVAVAVTFALTWLVIGYLNTQTAFLGSIVVGNGINYGLIYLARVKQLRQRGDGLAASCVDGALTTAKATLLASAATSVSFGVLILAANRGFRHFGFIGGIGMLLCWVFTFALVPALLSIFEKLRGPPRLRPMASGERFVPALTRFFAHRRAIVVFFVALTAAAAAAFGLQLRRGAMERNLDNLSNELKGRKTLTTDNQRANEALGKSLAGAIALLDSRDDADAFCAVIRERMKTPPNDKLIDGCDTISSVVPARQQEKLAVIRQIVDELPDSLLRKISDPVQQQRLRTVRDQLAAQKPVSADQAPPTLLDRFRERDGTLGRIAAVTAKGTAELEIAKNLQDFVRAVRNVPVNGKSYDATGDKVIFADLLKDIEVEGPRTTFLSLAGVLLLVFIFFRNLRTSLEVVGSLTSGVLLMCGVAAVIDLKINFFNFIVFPITFGIAVDYGANVASRVKERGGQVVASLAEVGPAVALCSWTTLVGYGTLLYSLNRALRSFGWYAMIGEATTIVTALVLLPALLLLAKPRESASGRG